MLAIHFPAKRGRTTPPMIYQLVVVIGSIAA